MKDLTQGNIFKTFFLFGFPLVLSGLLSQTYNVIDTAIAGKFLGESGLASIGATSPLITFFSSLFWGFGVGVSVYVAKLYGRGDYEKIKKIFYSTYFFTFIACGLIALCSLVFYKPLFALLKIEESLHKDALTYFAVYIIGFPFVLFSSFGVFFTTALGIGSFPFYMSLISALVNIGGNLLTVAVLDTGIIGLAISTVLSGFVVTICYFIKFRKCFKEMGVQNTKISFRLSPLKRALPYALPNTAQQSVMYLSSLLLSPLVNHLGVASTASYAVVLQVYNFIASVYQNSARSVSNYSAQCLGKKQTHFIKKGVFAGLIQGLAFTAPFLIVCLLFHREICSLFFKADATIETKEYAYLFISTYLPFVVLNIVCNLFHGLFRGVKATWHLFCTTFFGALTRYIFSAIFIRFYGMEGFFIGWVFSWLLEAILCLTLFFVGKWKPKEFM